MRYAIAILAVVFFCPTAVSWLTQVVQCHPALTAAALVSGAVYTAAAVEEAIEE